MKVAIIGAGAAGMACAYALEKHGITPVVFEKQGSIGNPYGHTSTTFKLFDRTIVNPFSYLKKRYRLDLRPLYPLKEVVMKGPSKKITIHGNLGYVFKRGYDSFSIENQIAAQTTIPVIYNNYVKVKDIKDQFDHIVVATGNSRIANELGLWDTSINIQMRVAKVIGNFKVGTLIMWLNTLYSKSCYCYLLPTSDREASLVLSINNITASELDYHWKEFLFKEEINYTIPETIDSEYTIGSVRDVCKDNVYFVGNAAGLSDDFLGFGAITAIESGILAARAITKGIDYKTLIQPFLDDVASLHQFRKSINNFDNKDFDRLLTFLGLPGIKQFIYNNPFLKARYGTQIVKLYNRLIYK